jgi:hypothetical protein
LAYLSGSLAAGLGHANSDLDIHVVLASGRNLEHPFARKDGLKVQLNVVPEQVIGELAEATRGYEVRPSNRDQVPIESARLWQMARTCESEFLDGEDAELLSLYRSIDRAVAGKLIAFRFAAEAGLFAEDAYGMLARGDIRSSLVAARMALACSAEVAVALLGDLYALPKFLLARLERHAEFDDCIVGIWDLLQRAPEWSNLEAIAELIPRILRAGQQLSADGLLSHWSGGGAAYRLPPLANDGPKRDPERGLLRFEGTWGIAGPTEQLRVGEDMARLWAACNGQSRDGVQSELIAQGVDAPSEELAAQIQRLQQRGVLSA